MEEIENNEIVDKTSAGVYVLSSLKVVIPNFFMFLIGAFLFFVSVIGFVYDISYIETTAVIVDVKYDEFSERYYPIYEYEVNGEIVREDGFPSSDMESIEIGKVDYITYNPKDYTQFNIGSKEDGLILFGISILLLGFSVTFFIKFILGLKIVLKGNN